MKFTCERTVLQQAVSIAARAASSKNPMPALEGLLLEATPGGVKITGYDLKKAIYTMADANVLEQGSIVLGAKMFSSIVSSLPDGVVTVDSKEMNTSITCLSADYTIIGTDAREFPELPDLGQSKGVSLPQNLLGKMIRQTIFAVSDNESRPIYTGEKFDIDSGLLTLVAIDGYRLALRREAVEGVGEPCSFVVPGNALGDLEKLCADTEDPVQINLGDKHISFSIGTTVLISRRLEGDFLDYKKTVPNQFSHRVRADRQILQRTVERVSLIIDDRVKNPLRCTFANGELRISCATALGKAEDACPLDGDGGNVQIGFNNRYLLDSLKAAPADEVELGINSGSSPIVLLPADGGEQFLYMILPVRLKAE